MNRIACRYFLIAAVFLTLMDVHAQEQLPYQANFDVDDGFQAGNVDGIETGYSQTPIPGNRRRVITTGKAPQALSWIKTETMFTALEDIEHGYTIKQYALDQVVDSKPIGDPYKVIRIYNPAPYASDTVKRLIFEEMQDGRHSMHEYRFQEEENGQETWQLFQGAPGSYLDRPLRLTELIINDPDADAQGEFTKTRRVKHWNTASQRLETDSVQRERYHR